MSHPIPLVYRIVFNYLEPIMASLGALQALFKPRDLILLATPNVPYTSATQPLLTQLAGGWFLLVFHDIVTLRLTRDLRIWRAVLGASLISDIFYTLSMVQDKGATEFFSLLGWKGTDLASFVMTLIPMLFKVGFLLGIHLARSDAGKLNHKTP
jgi:hypothetical protein